MSFYRFCGVSCMITSIWAIIQLTLMGIFYKIEAVVLIEDVEPYGPYISYDKYLQETKFNYLQTAINCWSAAGLYVITLLIAILCLRKAKKIDKMHAALTLDDDDRVCQPQAVDEPKKKKCIVM